MYAADNHEILLPFVKNPDDPNREEPHNPNRGLSTFECPPSCPGLCSHWIHPADTITSGAETDALRISQKVF